MNEILHANIFFIIASIATVCFCVMICIVLYHLIKIMKSVRAIMNRVEAGSAVLAEDIDAIRSVFLSGGLFSRLFDKFFGGGETSDSVRRRPRPARSITKKITQLHDKEKDNGSM